MPTVQKQSNKPVPTTQTSQPTQTTVSSVWGLTESLHMLVYGQSGTGKTTFASTFPSPILWLICSGGSRPGELKSIDTPENRERIDPVIVSESSQLSRIPHLGKLGDLDRYKTVVLDHASGLADLMLKEILGLDSLPAQKGWGLASQSQYGQLSLCLKEMFRTLLNLPSHVVIIAQERVFGGDGDQLSEVIKPTVGAALTPSVTGWLGPAVDYVVQTFKRPRMRTVTTESGGQTLTQQLRDRGVHYSLRTGPDDLYQTKFRVPKGRVLPDYLDDPDFDKVTAVIRGG